MAELAREAFSFHGSWRDGWGRARRFVGSPRWKRKANRLGAHRRLSKSCA